MVLLSFINCVEVYVSGSYAFLTFYKIKAVASIKMHHVRLCFFVFARGQRAIVGAMNLCGAASP